MGTPVEDTFTLLAKGIISKLEQRNMEGYYAETKEALVEKIFSMMPPDSVISWGGSMSMIECGLMDALKNSSYRLINRDTAKTPQEKREILAKTMLSDFYFMGTNAITMEGELLNIDGNGNRVACLCNGPSNVMVIAGRNKVTENLETALSRARNTAAPVNVKRLNRNTPCNTAGRCANCLSPESICSQFVVTRRSGEKGRIKVFLVNEVLGY